jgi:hypothetical protein
MLNLKLKLKVANLEEADCTLTPWRSSLIHLHRRHHTKRRESHLLAKEGTFIEGILQAIRNLLQLLGSFTCRKVGTWDRLFNFPSEGRHAEDSVHRKNPTASAGFEPANSETGGQHAHRSRHSNVLLRRQNIICPSVSSYKISIVPLCPATKFLLS